MTNRQITARRPSEGNPQSHSAEIDGDEGDEPAGIQQAAPFSLQTGKV